MYTLLSHLVDQTDDGYPGEPTLLIENKTRIANGDAYNSAVLHLFNHFGTHMDAPKHFVDSGASIAELPLARFIYEKPLLLDIQKSFGELLEMADVVPHHAKIKQADLLMIRTGIGQYRSSQSQRYSAEGTAISTALAHYLVSEFPHLKALGLDSISLASPAHPAHGISAHQAILGAFSEHFICVIEDMALAHVDASRLQRVFALPLLVKGIDSSLVTVLAELG